MAKRTQKFGLTLHYCSAYGAPPDELKLNWQENLNFLLSICPEIRQIESTIFYDFQLNDCIKDFVIHLGEMVDMLVKQVFPNLSEGNPTAHINVLLEVNCNTNQYEELLNNGHELLKKGHEIEVSELDYVEAYIARKCQITDKSIGYTNVNFGFWLMKSVMAYQRGLKMNLKTMIKTIILAW